MIIEAHCLITNEEKWIWYCLMALLPYVDKIVVWDTGSTDKTVDVVKSITSPKISFRQYGPVDKHSFTKARQEMLDQTSADWVMLVDGDEIWPDKVLKDTVATIKQSGDKYEFLVSRFINLVGDVYHCQDVRAEKYHIGPYVGNYTIRAVNTKKIPGLKFGRPYGHEGFLDETNQPIQDIIPFKCLLINEPYLHMTHLVRSKNRGIDKTVMQRSNKYKYELGHTMPKTFAYPSVFYFPHDKNISSPWSKRSLAYTLNASWQTPIKYFLRTL